MNKAEEAKACLDDPGSQACADAKELTKQSENITAEYAAEAAAKAAAEKANPWLKEIGSDSTMNALLWITDSKLIWSASAWSKDWWFTILSNLTVWLKDSLTWLMQLIAVWAFLFVWIRLAMARWNPEEFKKALQHMIYVIVWIFIVSIAWAAVVLVAGINL